MPTISDFFTANTARELTARSDKNGPTAAAQAAKVVSIILEQVEAAAISARNTVDVLVPSNVVAEVAEQLTRRDFTVTELGREGEMQSLKVDW